MSNIFSCTYICKLDIDYNLNISNLTNIYLPLIGTKSMSLYIYLSNTKNTIFAFKNNSKSLFDLCKILDISVNDFHKYRKRLEAFNLIKTYFEKDEINNTINYFFKINEPLSFIEFIKNNKFKKSLISKIGNDLYQELEFYYDIDSDFSKDELIEDYEDIFSEFKTENEYLFDFDNLINNVNKLIKSNLDVNEESKNIIDFYYRNYSFSYKQIEVSIINSIICLADVFSINNEKLEEELSNKINSFNDVISSKIVDIKRIDNFFKTKQDELVKKEIFMQYRNLNPITFLASVQKCEVSESDITLIKKLRSEYKLSNSIINILLDFASIKSFGTLNSTYVYKVAKSINLMHLYSLDKIYDYFYKVSNNKVNKSNKDKNINETNDLELVDLFS